MIFYSYTDTDVTFSLHDSVFAINTGVPVYLCGSFTEWNHRPDDRYRLEPVTDKPGIRCIVLPRSMLDVPGNSGHPEFKFQSFDPDGSCREYSAPADSSIPRFLDNFVLLYDNDDPEELKSYADRAEYIAGLKDFNPSKRESLHNLANFRRVPGSTLLYRSYHPYKKSFPHLETEDLRSATVKQLLKDASIQSVICLSGREAPDSSLGEEISVWHSAIIARGDVLFIDTSYEAAYYHTAEPMFLDVFAHILQFICDHAGPYLVHCRLGSDRTGVVSALLAALCGASWAEIAADYERTAQMAIREVRNSRLLAWAFTSLLGGTMLPDRRFNKELYALLVQRGIASEETLKAVIARLTA